MSDPAKCLCGHVLDDAHLDDQQQPGPCRLMACGCRTYRPREKACAPAQGANGTELVYREGSGMTAAQNGAQEVGP